MQMKKLVSVILAVCMLVSMFTILPLSAGAETATKTITVGVVEHLTLTGQYQVHYWGGATSGDVNLTPINTQKMKSVGNEFWNGAEQKFNMNEAAIPADATGFKVRCGDTWFGDNGDVSQSNQAFVFECGKVYRALYAYEAPAADPTTAPTDAPIVGGTTYYLVGSFTDWQINEDYALAANAEAEGEYMITGVELAKDAEFKVISFTAGVLDGNTTWYPDGENNNYVVAADGTYDIYFRPGYDGGENWYYNCIYAAAQEEPTQPVVGASTFYVIGSFTDWQTAAAYAMTKNAAAEGDEYMLTGVELSKDAELKVVETNGSILNFEPVWYPEGMGNNYGENGEIEADGTYTIYFRPNYDGGEDWFYNCIYVAEFVAPVTEPETEPETEPASEPSTEPSTEPSDLNGIVDGFYYENGELVKGKGLVEFEGDIYFVKNDGSIYTNGTLKVAEAKTNGLLPAGNYTFNAEGKRVSDGLIDGYFYVNGEKAKGAGVVEYKNCFYFVKNDGSVYTNGRLSIKEEKTNGLLPAAAYNINEDGKILCNGAINGYFYIDGDKAKGAGVVSYGKALYFVRNDGTFYKNGRLSIKEEKTNGLVAAGAYNFDADGKMQDVKRIIKGYYYLNGQKVLGAGLIEYRGDFYFVKRNAAIYTNGTLLVTEATANGLVPEGRYTFGADGKMIIADQLS